MAPFISSARSSRRCIRTRSARSTSERGMMHACGLRALSSRSRALLSPLVRSAGCARSRMGLRTMPDTCSSRRIGHHRHAEMRSG
jgi:hypothetical protein